MDRRRFLLTSLAGGAGGSGDRVVARRAFVVGGVAALAEPLGADAQQTGKRARVGYLTTVTGPNPIEETFVRSLEQLGWTRGRNIRIESRYTAGRQDTIEGLAAELVGLGLDVIVAWGPPAVAVKRATSNVPIVFLSVLADPVELGLVSNLARPGGNVTGVTVHGVGTDAKRLQLLKEAVPSLRRVTLLLSSERSLTSEGRRLLSAAAKDLDLEIHEMEVATTSAVDTVVRKARNRGTQALYVWPSGFTFAFAREISDSALASQLPSIHGFRESVVAGGFLSYAPSLTDVAQRGAIYVDKILRGTKPGDLPIDQPTRFELAINLKTAKALGLTIPPSLLARADHVIE
jgi:putative tryptophan/tyrosine transport system substrate-binding protein